MKTALILLAVIVVWFAARWAYAQVFGVGEIVYRGETIRLSRKYTDYDQYKNDTANIAKEELSRVERLIREAKIGPVFKDWSAFVHAESEIKFPGYGAGGGPKVASAGREVIVSSVEIPSRPPGEKYRYFVLEKQTDGSLRIIDDFIEAGFPRMAVLTADEGRLVCRNADQAVIRERQW
ncbi:MAG TPA: hypothetical protein VK178_12575 [Opitutaceae bacterium]|nr:hypothetical protein [Opitutaceae bacterium]